MNGSGSYEVTFLPSGKQAKVRPGTSVLDASRRAGLSIATRCGGKAACLMCKVRDASGRQAGLSAVADNERYKLGGMHEEGYRLACQAKVTGDASIEVPEDPLHAAIRKQLERQREEEDSLW
ncbi:2Fe-2S iron-sulfur cluster-binding protein [Paenibacillus kobensis]|uniref:2Fe-2S iron-sulfur cluster-binding protein n=1 Tax=Paenibacillus kobensis TaxID=59841 RepID=UPI000FD80CD2|nr:2Fe-2S iron-sulfur cluster-binding protein [Paenibacillus kobensis]